jgi:hypothetical protein
MEFLAHRNNSPQVDMLLLSDTLSWFQANQSLLLFHQYCVLSKKQQRRHEHKIYHTWSEHANHYTTDVVRNSLESHIGGVMVGMLKSSVVDHGYKPKSGHTKDYIKKYLLLLR